MKKMMILVMSILSLSAFADAEVVETRLVYTSKAENHVVMYRLTEKSIGVFDFVVDRNVCKEMNGHLMCTKMAPMFSEVTLELLYDHTPVDGLRVYSIDKNHALAYAPRVDAYSICEIGPSILPFETELLNLEECKDVTLSVNIVTK